MSGSGAYNKYPPNFNFGGKKVLNVGCGFEQWRFPNVTNVDKYDICQPDLVWDLNNPPLPIADNTFDFIIANHILEHLDNWWELFNDCARMVKPGGMIEVWGPGDGQDGQLGYRDHVAIVNRTSFFGVFQNYRYGGNAFAEATRIQPANRMKIVQNNFAMEREWWIKFAPKSLRHWMAKHLRNVVAEQQFVFRKVTDEEWEAEERKYAESNRRSAFAEVLQLRPTSVSKRA